MKRLKTDMSLTAEEAIERIKRLDGEINAVITVTEQRAKQGLESACRRREAGEELPLFGVPVAVKDNILVRGEKTTCASRMLENYVAPYDADAVERLERAGAVIVAKANLDEFAMGSTGKTSCFGPTRNPLDTRRTPGGSSSGSAAALAAGYTPLALGTDTGGSARLPAAWCGVWALKPSYGAVSRYGAVAFASSMDQICPMALDGDSLALLTDVIAGRDSRDATSVGLEKKCHGMRARLSGLSVAVPEEMLTGCSDAVGQAVEEAIVRLEQMGAKVEKVSLPGQKYAVAAYDCLASVEAGMNLARFDGVRFGLPGQGEDFDSIVRSSRTHGFGTEVKARLMRGVCVLDTERFGDIYIRARAARGMIKRQMEEILKIHRLILAPTAADTAPLLEETARHYVDMCCTAANLAYLPAVSFPWSHADNGMPIGLQFMGRRFDDGFVIAAARALRGEA